MIVITVSNTAVLAEVVDAGNPVSLSQRLLDDVPTDETRRTGKDDVTACSSHKSVLVIGLILDRV
jgi:hypothetical protein